MVFRLFSNPAEAHQFSLEREGHRGGLAFEYLARYPEISRVFRIEHALGDDTDSIIERLQRGPDTEDDEDVVIIPSSEAGSGARRSSSQEGVHVCSTSNCQHPSHRL